MSEPRHILALEELADAVKVYLMKKNAKKKAKHEAQGVDFGSHEVLDRAWLISHTFDTFICEHPYVQATPELRLAAARLSEQLGAFYQLAGRFDFEEGEG